MNVLNLVFSLNNGGIEHLLYDTLNNWENNKINQSICVINEDYNYKLMNKFKSIKNTKLILLHKKKSWDKLRVLLQLIFIIKKHKINIIHIHSEASLKVIKVIKMFYRNVKIVYTIHDVGIVTKLNEKEKQTICNHVSKMLSISSKVDQEIRSQIKNFNQDNIIKVFNGVNFDDFEKKKKTIHDPIILGTLSRIDIYKKGLDIFIEALNILNNRKINFMVYIAGSNKDRTQITKLQSIIQKYNLSEQIILEGDCNNKYAFYSKIDLFILPSRFEGFGLTVIESIASLTPVIASDIDGPSEILNNTDFLFEVSNAEELANKVEYVITNYNSIDMDKLFMQMRSKFSISTYNTQLAKIYKLVYTL